MVASFGAVPIPTAPSSHPTATASEQDPTIVEMGAPVRVTLPGSVSAVVTALGPVELTPQPGRKNTVGIITVRLTTQHGTLRVRSSDFSSRNDVGQVVALGGQGARTARATPKHPARLKVRGTYESGAAQMTWRHDGKIVAIWDFNIELD